MIKSEFNTNGYDPLKENYPFLGGYVNQNQNQNDFIVLFNSYQHGMVIYTDCIDYEIGYISNNWNMLDFIKLPNNNIIQLSNK